MDRAERYQLFFDHASELGRLTLGLVRFYGEARFEILGKKELHELPNEDFSDLREKIEEINKLVEHGGYQMTLPFLMKENWPIDLSDVSLLIERRLPDSDGMILEEVLQCSSTLPKGSLKVSVTRALIDLFDSAVVEKNSVLRWQVANKPVETDYKYGKGGLFRRERERNQEDEDGKDKFNPFNYIGEGML